MVASGHAGAETAEEDILVEKRRRQSKQSNIKDFVQSG